MTCISSKLNIHLTSTTMRSGSQSARQAAGAYTNSTRHRQASQLSRESMLCASRLATGDDKKAAGAGKLTHHISQEQVKGRPAHSQVHDSPVPGSQCCLLEVLDVSPVQAVHEVAAEWGPVVYEALLELHTGRTHQASVAGLR